MLFRAEYKRKGDNGLFREFFGKNKRKAIRYWSDTKTNTGTKSKKKVYEELNEYFPEFFEKGRFQEITSKEKKKLLLEIEEVLEKKNNKELINNIESHILGMTDIANFNDFGDDKQHDKDFEQLCAYLQKETMRNVKDMTVFEFYSLMSNVYDKKRVKISG
ncbi:MAG: hypothetical protein ACUZ8E_05615 [Candidatus Anammoxibacter sp.]